MAVAPLPSAEVGATVPGMPITALLTIILIGAVCHAAVTIHHRVTGR